jgi:hypothetical protein
MPPDVEALAGGKISARALASGAAFRLDWGATAVFRAPSFGTSWTKAALAPLAVIGRLVMTFCPGSRGAAWHG